MSAFGTRSYQCIAVMITCTLAPVVNALSEIILHALSTIIYKFPPTTFFHSPTDTCNSYDKCTADDLSTKNKCENVKGCVWSVSGICEAGEGGDDDDGEGDCIDLDLIEKACKKISGEPQCKLHL